MNNKMICLFVVLIIICSLISCSVEEVSEPSVIFDSGKYSSSKSLWTESKIDNYSFKFKVRGSSGTEVEGFSKVIGNTTDTVLTVVTNQSPDEMDENIRNKEIHSLSEQGYILDSVDSIYECILKLDKRLRARVEKDRNEIKSVYLLISYNKYGIPVSIETCWVYDGSLEGLMGPYITISDFTAL